MNKIRFAVGVALSAAAVASSAVPSAYADTSRCEISAINFTCPVQHPEQWHVHGETDTDSLATGNVSITPGTGGLGVSGSAAIVETGDIISAHGTVGPAPTAPAS